MFSLHSTYTFLRFIPIYFMIFVLNAVRHFIMLADTEVGVLFPWNHLKDIFKIRKMQ